jgi:hypothetical protein
MLVAREEIFGPLAPIFEFDTEADAVPLANDTEFGLAGYFFSKDIGSSHVSGTQAAGRDGRGQHREDFGGRSTVCRRQGEWLWQRREPVWDGRVPKNQEHYHRRSRFLNHKIVRGCFFLFLDKTDNFEHHLGY